VTTTILLVEDDPETARTLTSALTSSGYEVTTAETGAAARSIIERTPPDLIIMDLMLPDTDGLILTASFKALTKAPIIICSARHQQVDTVLGLKLGADDFIAKPFELEDFEARVEAVLRRASPVQGAPAAHADQIQVGELRISQSRGTVVLAGQHVHLTPIEYRLLVTLARHPGEVLSRATLGQLVWGYDDVGTGHLIDVHIGRLRHKLHRASSSGPVIGTVRGKGFTIGIGSSDPAAP
jgi:DNA-binding response OmpR family regulator